jgi:putative hydrolase of the HAD superfamily
VTHDASRGRGDGVAQAVRRCRALSFDGDMTLWDFERVMRHSLSIALDGLRRALPGPATERLTVDEMIAIRNGVATSLRGRVTDLEAIRLQAFVRTLERVGSDDRDLAAKLNALYLHHRFEDIELYDDVAPTLTNLSRHRPCGLISNGNSYPERCGLADIFSFVVFSQDVGIEKPDPAIFETALDTVGCEPHQLVHIGDSLRSDVAGANAVGAVSVSLNREGVENRSGIVPDYEIGTLGELLETVPRSARPAPNRA